MPESFDPPPVTLHDLDDVGEAAWDAFVEARPDATFCHRAGWRRVIEATFGHACHFRVARRGGRVVGVLPLVHVRGRLFGDALISTAFCVYGGIAASDAQAAAALLADAIALGERLGVGHIELRHRTPILEGSEDSPLYATFRRPLSTDERENFLAIPRKKRADVRKSLNAGLRLRLDAEVDAFYAVYAESVRNLGTPVYPRRFFHEIKRAFGRDVEVSLVEGASGPLAALVTFYFRDEVLPYYGGAVPAARPVHAYDFQYWMLMSRAVERGARLYDFGRSKRGTGAFDYKTFWGFAPEPLHYHHHLIRAPAPPEINPLNPKYRLLVAAWRRLPLWVANRLGPVITRGIG